MNNKLKALNNFYKEFSKDKTGIVGFVIIIIAILISLFEPVIIPYKQASKRWRDISYWEDNPKSAPPVWINIFKKNKSATTKKIEATSIETNNSGYTIKFNYNYKSDEYPLDIIFHFLASGNTSIKVDIKRPDNLSFTMLESLEQNLNNSDLRLSMYNDAKPRVFRFYRDSVDRLYRNRLDTLTANPMSIIFNTIDNEMAENYKALKGEYTFTITAEFLDTDNIKKLDTPYMIIVGSVSGLMGTDNMKRDIFSGLISGLKWAMFIGIAVSFISVIIGVMYGIVSAYFGGRVDSLMQFIYQIFIGIPVLPVMIVLSAIYKPNIWTMISLMIIFSWTGSVLTVRSMSMQIKEETYIQAAKAIGASHTRIIIKHLTPLLLPYSFASMALSVPSAIVYESSLSLLGLGDATIVTWGQILHDAMKGSAILSGVWWWIIPPGVLIAILGMSFAFIGFALDKILHPKLRTR